MAGYRTFSHGSYLSGVAMRVPKSTPYGVSGASLWTWILILRAPLDGPRHSRLWFQRPAMSSNRWGVSEQTGAPARCDGSAPSTVWQAGRFAASRAFGTAPLVSNA